MRNHVSSALAFSFEEPEYVPEIRTHEHEAPRRGAHHGERREARRPIVLERHAEPHATHAGDEVVAHHGEIHAVFEEHPRDAGVAVGRELNDDAHHGDDDAEDRRRHASERAQCVGDDDRVEIRIAPKNVEFPAARDEIDRVETEEQAERSQREHRYREDPAAKRGRLLHAHDTRESARLVSSRAILEDQITIGAGREILRAAGDDRDRSFQDCKSRA